MTLCGCEGQPEANPETTKSEDTEIRAVWIYYDELSMLGEKENTAERFTEKISLMLDKCASYNINTVFVQIRPFGDAFYNSEIFPSSYYLAGKQGENIGYDALKICIEQAHSRNISLHAWLNPFRVMYYSKKFELAESNPCYEWIEEKSENIITTDEGIFMCPASLETQKLVTDGVREIVANYDVDGIHIDDYFYPTADESADRTFYKKYTDNVGTLTLDEWRRTNISALVSSIYSAVKTAKSDCIFSISPQGNIDNNLNSQFADVMEWCTQNGYADWIIPQVYYSFDNTILPFDKAVNEWNELNSGNVRLIWGIALYKSETEFGENEIKKQIEYLKQSNNYNGYAVFSYSYLDELCS